MGVPSRGVVGPTVLLDTLIYYNLLLNRLLSYPSILGSRDQLPSDTPK